MNKRNRLPTPILGWVAQKKATNTMATDTAANKKRTANDAVPNINAAIPLTEEGFRPQKRFYRQRAHCNPLSHNDAFEYPLRPAEMDWTQEFFPGMPTGTVPSVLDVGCGFGGLTLALATILPDKVIMGMEIRAKVCHKTLSFFQTATYLSSTTCFTRFTFR